MKPATSPFPVSTKDAGEVERFTSRVFYELFPGTPIECMGPAFHEVARLFAGQHPAYLANDLKYHDFEHTLQATVCLVELLAGRHRAGADPVVQPRQFEFAVISALLHDSGYHKLRTDTEGTGAKYTFFHVLRSCAFAASYLPTIGASAAEIEQALGAINCTGPASKIGFQFDRILDLPSNGGKNKLFLPKS